MLAFRDFDTLYETSDEQNFRYFSLYFQLAKFSYLKIYRVSVCMKSTDLEKVEKYKLFIIIIIDKSH